MKARVVLEEWYLRWCFVWSFCKKPNPPARTAPAPLTRRRAGDDITDNPPPPDAGAGWEDALFAALQTPADDRPEPQAEPPARVDAPDYHTVLHRDRVTLLQLVPYLWTHGGDGIMLLLELWEDVDTPFVHDASMLWSRGRIQYWIYFPLTMEKK